VRIDGLLHLFSFTYEQEVVLFLDTRWHCISP